MNVSSESVILFDAVNTLIYADPSVAEVYCEAGRRHGVSLSMDEISKRFATSFRQRANDSLESSDAIERQRWRTLVAEVFHEQPASHEQLFSELWQHFADPTSWRVFDDVADCLADLRQRGVRIGVASNFDERLQPVCQGHKILSDVQLFWSADVGYSKPHPSFFRTIEMRIDTSPEQMTLVGDDLQADYSGAKEAGWTAVLLDRECRFDQPSIRSLTELSDGLPRPSTLASDGLAN